MEDALQNVNESEEGLSLDDLQNQIEELNKEIQPLQKREKQLTSHRDHFRSQMTEIKQKLGIHIFSLKLMK